MKELDSNCINIDLVAAPIDIRRLEEGLYQSESGGLVTFNGTVRNHHKGKKVEYLFYEAYESMVLEVIESIAKSVVTEYPVNRVSIVHRFGKVDVLESAVWIGVSSDHRAEAFAACRALIDRIKNEAPIWKHEFYSNGQSAWVGCEGCKTAAHRMSKSRGPQNEPVTN